MAFGHFTYNGKSTLNIISVPLLMVNSDSIDSIGVNRSKIEGESTILHPNTNEYGTVYDALSFTFALVKESDVMVTFTEQEQRKIEKWLTSPKTSREMAITNCDGNIYYYSGIFTNLSWTSANGGNALINVTFVSKTPYPYKNNTAIIWNPESPYNTQWPPHNHTDTPILLTCNSDEEEEYIYPEVIVMNSGANNTNFMISNQTEYLSSTVNSMYVSNNINYNMLFDCDKNIVYRVIYNQVTDEYEKINTLTMKDLGWQKRDYINWLRLYPDENRLSITSDAQIILRYKTVYKKVGAWLV